MASARSLARSANLLGLAVGLALLGLWQGLVETGVLDFHFLVSPSESLEGLGELAETGAFWDNLVHTTANALVAWALAMLVGVGVGFAIGLNRGAWRWSMASVDVFRTIPSVAFIPVAILILGPASKSEIVVAGYAAVWPVLVTAVGGVRGAPPRLHDVAATFRIPTSQRIRKIVLPGAVPSILVGARLALTLSLVVVVVTEMIGPPMGLGYGLIEQQRALQPERLWAYVLVIAVLGLILNAILNGLVRWRLRGFAPVLDGRRG